MICPKDIIHVADGAMMVYQRMLSMLQGPGIDGALVVYQRLVIHVAGPRYGWSTGGVSEACCPCCRAQGWVWEWCRILSSQTLSTPATCRACRLIRWEPSWEPRWAHRLASPPLSQRPWAHPPLASLSPWVCPALGYLACSLPLEELHRHSHLLVGAHPQRQVWACRWLLQGCRGEIHSRRQQRMCCSPLSQGAAINSRDVTCCPARQPSSRTYLT